MISFLFGSTIWEVRVSQILLNKYFTSYKIKNTFCAEYFQEVKDLQDFPVLHLNKTFLAFKHYMVLFKSSVFTWKFILIFNYIRVFQGNIQNKHSFFLCCSGSHILVNSENIWLQISFQGFWIRGWAEESALFKTHFKYID